jgi:DNA processing protein
MIIKKLTLTSPDFPEVLRNIPSPPRQLYVAGAPLAGLLQRPRVAIVGTRKISPYGQQVTWEFARDLAQQGVVIISGLALGLDALAHKAAHEHGGLCIAVLPCPLEKIVPMTNRRLAQRILDSGGALVSEYPEPEWPKRQYFIARNRIVSGLADAVLIPEAGIKSGALHTARFAVEQGKNMLAVPGSIYAPGCAGTNNLIKASQAGAVTTPDDVLNTLDLQRHSTPAKQVKGANAREQAILDLLLQGISKGHLLLEHSRLEVPAFNQTLVMLEITGKIRPLGADHWAIT